MILTTELFYSKTQISLIIDIFKNKKNKVWMADMSFNSIENILNYI